jgi:predicted enzyme related to lactoylglutathione lyase
VDALQARLLTHRFGEMFAFYDAVLPVLAKAELARGDAAGPYANWDAAGQGLLVLFDRAAMAATVGTGGLPADPPPAQDRSMLVCRVDDVDDALALCLHHGASLAAQAADRPDWGPALRTAHIRDPDGNLIEL